jgi:signal transduction histidine kinase
MRFRTKVFFGWAALTICLLTGTFFAMRRSVETSFARMSEETFAGINRGMRHLYLERVSSMQRACDLLVNIPELRALIAEHNYELSRENQASLQDRLDDIGKIVGATFVLALDRSGVPIAQNKVSPWSSSAGLGAYLKSSAVARSLIDRTFEPLSKGQNGLWVCCGRLYEVAAVPLVFQSEADAKSLRPDGALVMGKQLTDTFARELGKSYGCEISFLTQDGIAASSLSDASKNELLARLKNVQSSSPPDIAEMQLSRTSYRTALEPLIDPCSGQSVGSVVIHQDQANANGFLWAVMRNLVLVTLGGLLAAAIASYCLSLMITRPVQALVTGVREVAQGNLNVQFESAGRDELGELSRAFNDMVRQLSRSRDELQANQRQIIQTERLRAVGQMASGIAHDFNNHLTGVLAFLEMSLDRDDLAPELRGWLELSRESSVAAASVVTLLRSFYRRDTSEGLQAVDINELAAGTISLTRPRWREMPRQHGITLDVKEDFQDVGCVLGNAAELRDALTNLLFNAVDAMPGGGEITIRTRRINDFISLEIQDAGTGMTDEVRERCLEPYFTTKGVQGTGLGLSMVHGIVERNRGRLEIDTALGRGTTIRLILPRAATSVAAAPVPSLTPSDRRRVICVDDDTRILKALEGMLRQLGHEVTTTDSGTDVIRRIEAERFDVLITDLGMPGVDGREVARSAKRLSPSTRVLLLTGWADRLQVEGEIPAGVDKLLGKPITKEQLRQALA